jgi:hypothetical protein
MNLSPKPLRKANETRDLVEPIVADLNSIPGVRVFRPKVLNRAVARFSGAGLSVGSADIVGLCAVPILVPVFGAPSYPRGTDGRYCIGRFFALEVKQPGKRVRIGSDQDRWRKMVRDLGGFCGEVHSFEEARAAVGRCREGRSE